jgi:hypothetical protein
MQIINAKNQLTIDLFHGTSTLFLDSIIKHGLGGLNPVNEWNLLELSRDLYRLSEKYLSETGYFQENQYGFQRMTEQSSGGSANYQHGQTYPSPSKFTALRYARNYYGSELLTEIMNHWKELLKLEDATASNYLAAKYPKILSLMGATLQPLLIRIKNVEVSSLLSEKGEDPNEYLRKINDAKNKESYNPDTSLQQTNFRLTKRVSVENLTIWEVYFTNDDVTSPEYSLSELNA